MLLNVDPEHQRQKLIVDMDFLSEAMRLKRHILFISINVRTAHMEAVHGRNVRIRR